MPADAAATQDLTDWILRHATASDEGITLLEELGGRLIEAGVPVFRLAVAMPTINPDHRGININWQRGSGTSLSRTAHGAEGDADYNYSPIRLLVDSGLSSGRWRLQSGEGCNRFPLLGRIRDQGGTDYMLHVVGFSPGTAVMGAGLSFVSDRPGGFGESDLALFAHLLPALGLAFYRLSQGYTMRHLLAHYVGERTAARVLSGQIRRGRGELIAAAILLVDLKGFTAATDAEDPLRVVGWLDEHLDALGQDVASDGGEILKFTGDGFIAVFPVTDRDARPCGVCRQALATARAALARNRALQARRSAAGEPALAADLALHFGDVVYGNIGTGSRLDFTAIGRAVNEASRIEALCDATGRSILISDSFAGRCHAPLVDLGAFALRGVGAPQRIWTVAEPSGADPEEPPP